MGQTQNIEQQIRLLSNLQLGFGIAALLFLALAIFLFFYLHIPQVFNEYRGKSAQKAMEEMAANSSDSGRIVSMNKKSKNKKKGTGQLVQRRHYTDNLTDDLSGRMSQEYIAPEVVTSPQEAFYADKRSVRLEDSVGQVCSEFVMCYPPGIPILAPGERITAEILDYIRYAKEKGCSMTGPEDPEIEEINILTQEAR